ncbi:MAG TPA: 1-deoxy-D-xylulose-5-phosphate synthase [Acidimicrobiales bacterium]|nr:1-deoxy-D-xylulose-5-phosphate synthase [Acidimicrobiales bacterium]
MLLEKIESPADLRSLELEELPVLADEIREFIVQAVSVTGGHLGSNLGAVELTLAVHRVFDSPRDVILWDTGHQAYVHKIVTGRREAFATLRQQGGLSGYPARSESAHDWIENSHASTVLSYAHGLATAVEEAGSDRHVVAVIGDGSMTGGMAFEGLNNLGHSGRRVVILLNDNGRSYGPTASRLGESLARLRLHPSWVHLRHKVESRVRHLPAVGSLAYSSLQGMKAAVREVLEPTVFFEALGVRYTGPFDGHDIGGMEAALRNASEYDGPIVVHVLTQKGRGYPPAEDDDEKCLHDAPVFNPETGPPKWAPAGYTEAFAEAMVEIGERHPQVHAITAAMPGPTGLLAFQERFPQRFHDVGIAEQHAVTAAAGMAMGGLRPVVAVYSTFFSRAFDQANLDVGLHGLPVVFALDRAGITGDDGPSHHGVLDIAQCLQIPGLTILAPSSAQEVVVMLRTALELEGPVAVRYPKGSARQVPPDEVGSGLMARLVRQGAGDVCLLAVGKLVAPAQQAAQELHTLGIDATVWDVRAVRPLDPAMVSDAAGHRLVVTLEDGVALGGAGTFIAQTLASTAGGGRARVLVLGAPSEFLASAPASVILTRLGLDAPGIAAAVVAELATWLESPPLPAQDGSWPSNGFTSRGPSLATELTSGPTGHISSSSDG